MTYSSTVIDSHLVYNLGEYALSSEGCPIRDIKIGDVLLRSTNSDQVCVATQEAYKFIERVSNHTGAIFLVSESNIMDIGRTDWEFICDEEIWDFSIKVNKLGLWIVTAQLYIGSREIYLGGSYGVGLRSGPVTSLWLNLDSAKNHYAKQIKKLDKEIATLWSKHYDKESICHSD